MNLGKTAALFPAAFLMALAAGSAFSSAVFAQAAQAEAYSTYTTKVGDLLANPATRAVLEKHFPGVSRDARMKMVKGKTFRQLHEMAPRQLPIAKLDAVDRDLRNIQVSAG